MTCLFFYSAVIEYTNRVIYMEDDDLASVIDGSKSLFCLFYIIILYVHCNSLKSTLCMGD
jgi:hypothetical protein